MTTKINHREKLLAIVGHDFVDATGARYFCLQLCQRTARGLSTVAILRNDTKPDVVDCLRPKLPAMQRLASIYMRRSTPMRFA